MYNGFTDSQPILHLTMKDSKMISTIVTDKQFVEYLANVIQKGTSKHILHPGFIHISVTEQRQNCVKWVVSSIVSEIEPIIQQKINEKAIINKIDIDSYCQFISYMDAFKKTGLVGKLKAANRLSKWLTTANEPNPSYYNSMGDIDIVHENSAVSDTNFFNWNLQKELPRILRAGATLLTGNSKLKCQAYFAQSSFGGNVPAVYAYNEGGSSLITVKGNENNSFCNVCDQLMKALTLMKVVSEVNIIRRIKNELTLSVVINSSCLGNRIRTGEQMKPFQSAKTIEVSLSAMLQSKMNELQKEKETLQARKQKLNDEVSSISCRIIQIGRQMASLHTSWEVMNEKPADGVNN